MKDTASEEDLRPLISACRKINEQHCQCRCPAKESIPQPWGALSSSLLSQPLTLGHSRNCSAPQSGHSFLSQPQGLCSPLAGQQGLGVKAQAGVMLWEGRECPGKGKGRAGLSDLSLHQGSWKVCKVVALGHQLLNSPFSGLLMRDNHYM